MKFVSSTATLLFGLAATVAQAAESTSSSTPTNDATTTAAAVDVVSEDQMDIVSEDQTQRKLRKGPRPIIIPGKKNPPPCDSSPFCTGYNCCTGYSWCELTGTCVAPGDDACLEAACDENSASTG
eukprot:CAMPEP_0171015294 /NCGR_PEP_ID=MMETSP0736-20130129/25830_1 /TAXON_ID=186038 /ORGANISM="Fragilariopsis kerguelensis, Strain L26-C5" /LENGTH=124 /DNA_ID=CAMNT_0011450069 /DNA_START=83 /DNA_END=458 /DNA_ORIENTATION=-